MLIGILENLGITERAVFLRWETPDSCLSLKLKALFEVYMHMHVYGIFLHRYAYMRLAQIQCTRLQSCVVDESFVERVTMKNADNRANGEPINQSER